MGAGVGVQARRFPAVDVDVTDKPFADQVAALAGVFLGAAPERVGRAPKRLLPYRLEDGAEEIHKRRVEFFLPGDPDTKHVVEFLGAGQQYVIEGTHAKTGNPYAWDRALDTVGAAGLSSVAAAGVDTFMGAVEQAVIGAGGTIKSRTTSGGGDRANIQQDRHVGDPARVREALKYLPNDFNYDDWIKACAAIKAAFAEDEAHYDAFEEWCLRFPENTPAMVRKKWDSLDPPYAVGAEWIYRKAAAAGWTGYATAIFQPLPPQSAEEKMADAPPMVREWVYVTEAERFIRLSDMKELKENAFNRLFAVEGYKLQGSGTAAACFFRHPARRMFDKITYLPGKPWHINEDGKTAVNTWRPSAILDRAKSRGATVKDSDVAPYLDHVKQLIPDASARCHVLDWMAFVVQHPDNKPNHAIFLGGDHGIGKDTAFDPLIEAVGKSNARTVQPGELASDYTDWIYRQRLVVVEEMRNFDTKTVMNKLEPRA